MRAHLEKVNASAASTPVLAPVYLSAAITPGKLENLASSYALAGGSHASTLVLVGPQASMGIELSDSVSANEIAQRTADALATLPPSVAALVNAPIDPQIAAFLVWATPEHLLALWDENPEIIRSIGVAGSHGNLLGAWRLAKPGEPLR